MKVTIVSGRSGSGKSTALHVLEDLGYYCIDNLPIGLLQPLTRKALESGEQQRDIAVSIDARNLSADIADFENLYCQLQHPELRVEIIYLDAADSILLKRFHQTRRKHPLSTSARSLSEAIQDEKALLEPIARLADLHIDTTERSMYELRDMVRERVVGRDEQQMALLIQSFGYKHGVPIDSDFVFDVRCLPNPFWDESLRGYTGLDAPIRDYLTGQPGTTALLDDIKGFLDRWLPEFHTVNRSYMTVSLGCTGGQHRSVYVAEELACHLGAAFSTIQVRHTELPYVQTET
ncbi:RNase adapter RapZ [Salicola sp. Rm-C-2C1-2]|uniref:RNase adapter RapZ n=1 Tax=Salicola sp. Rm-C-2C1-2 TaxID=3141321 RepID=UPI0032E3A191